MTLEPPYDCAKCQRMHYSNSGIYDNHLMYNATFYPNPKPDHSVQKAENGIRDMFLHKQYNGVVPDKDMDISLNSKRWHRFYGRSYLFKAWEGLINNGHVRRKGADWQWNFDPKTGKFRWAFPKKNRVRVRGNPEISLPDTNLYLKGFGRDSNWNSIIKLSYPNGKGFSIQTVQNMPKTHSIKAMGMDRLTSKELNIIRGESINYIQKYGSKMQKEGLRVYNSTNSKKPKSPRINPGNGGDVRSMTKEQAIDILIARIKGKWPTVDEGKERDILSKRSRADLLHSVGAQSYGNLDDYDDDMCKYAYSIMTDDEKRKINEAG